MSRTKVAVLALAGVALTMTAACGTNAGGNNAGSAGGGTQPTGDVTSHEGQGQVSTGPDYASHEGQGHVTDGSTPRCGTGDLLPKFGDVRDAGTGQPHIQLVYTNVSDKACDLHGTPGIDLSGPVDPAHGPVYSVPRMETGAASNVLQPGQSSIAELTVLQDGGPNAWVPTQLITIPPGSDTPRKLDWPYEFGVVRQDGATHPGTYVNGFGAK